MQTETSIDRLQQLLPQLFTPNTLEGISFLRVNLTPDLTVGLPLDCIEEVRLISVESITSMPNMPDPILGLVHSKGYVFWLVDLAKILGLASPFIRAKRYEMIMLQSPAIAQLLGASVPINSEQNVFLGCAVQQVKGTVRLLPDDIQTSFDQTLPIPTQILRGYAIKDKELIAIINP